MSSRAAITTLVHAYAERLDAGDLEGVARLFADATYGQAGGEVRHGADEVLAVLRRVVILYDGIPRTKHVISNLTIEIDEAGGAATARSYFSVLQAAAELPLQVIIAGRYHDRFARADGTWRFAERRILMDLVGDLSRHVRRVSMLPGG
jgi:hypothetical protein